MRIYINEKTTLKQIDDYINMVASKKNKLIDIEIPIKLSDYFSLSITLIQLIATWERNYENGSLIIDIDERNFKPDMDLERFLKKLYNKEYIYPIISLIWKTKNIVNKQNEDLKPILKDSQNKYLKNLKELEIEKNQPEKAKYKNPIKVGTNISLINIDNLKANLGVLPFLERNGVFTDEEPFNENLETIINEYILSYNKFYIDKIDEDRQDLIGILYELFKNTFEWGKLQNDNILNIRGAIIKHHKIHLVNFLNKSNESALIFYFKSKDLKIDENGNLHFIEISVLDVGEGFIKKASNEFKAGLKEIDVIKKCLQKYNTNAIGINSKNKGKGLFRILSILDKKGFIRIKTDKYCLYRNMIEQPIKENDDMDIFDWEKSTKENFTEYNECSGTVISIFYPLN